MNDKKVIEGYKKLYPLADGSRLYYFNAEGLGEDVDSIVQGFRTKNVWNICQCFYSHLRYYFDSVEELNRALNNNL